MYDNLMGLESAQEFQESSRTNLCGRTTLSALDQWYFPIILSVTPWNDANT